MTRAAESPTLLRCSQCDEPFKPNRGAKTCGRSECQRLHRRATRKLWEQENPRTEYNRSYYLTNKDRLNEASRQYYAATQPVRVEYRRQYYAAHRAEVIRAQREHTNRRRARAQNAPGDGVLLEDWMVILELCDFQCSYCRVDLDSGTGIELEHVIPISRGGWDDLSNVVPACRTCNASKNAKTAAEWMPEWVAPSWIILREVTV